jgi:uncharacterized protein with PIN domain
MSLVFDTSALVAYLNKEPGADLVESLLLDNPGQCYVHAINLCEVFYPLLRIEGADAAHEAISALVDVGLECAKTWMKLSDKAQRRTKRLIQCHSRMRFAWLWHNA